MISEFELAAISGGLENDDQNSEQQQGWQDDWQANQAHYDSIADAAIDAALSMNAEWLAGYDVKIELFTMGNFTLSYSGSLAGGFSLAATDCITGAAIAGGANHFATVAELKYLTSSAAYVAGCTAGVGAGILRDLFD